MKHTSYISFRSFYTLCVLQVTDISMLHMAQGLQSLLDHYRHHSVLRIAVMHMFPVENDQNVRETDNYK